MEIMLAEPCVPFFVQNVKALKNGTVVKPKKAFSVRSYEIQYSVYYSRGLFSNLPTHHID